MESTDYSVTIPVECDGDDCDKSRSILLRTRRPNDSIMPPDGGTIKARLLTDGSSYAYFVCPDCIQRGEQ